MLKSVKRDKMTYPQGCFDLLITFFDVIVRRVAYFIIIKERRKVLKERG